MIKKEIFRMIDAYATNMMSLDICGADKKNLESFFGTELIEETFSGKIDDLIFGCRHKLRNCKYSCYHFINKNSKFISDKYEPINKKVIK